MKFYYPTIITFLFCLTVSAQTGKVYILKDGKYSISPKKAVSYQIIQKLNDSGFLVKCYDMRDTILWAGSYKDSSLSIPHGKFVYYRKRTIDPKLRGVVHTDTNNFIQRIGYYADGLKTGTWIEYERRNKKIRNYIYQKGALNGLYQEYYRSPVREYPFEYIVEEGQYVNNKKEGDWNLYGFDTLKTPVTTQFFENDKLIRQIDHIKFAYFSLNLKGYFSKKLRSIDTTKVGNVKVDILINEAGLVANARIISNVPPEQRDILIDAFANMPRFQPEIHDGKPVPARYEFNLYRRRSPMQIGEEFEFSLRKKIGDDIYVEAAQFYSWLGKVTTTRLLTTDQ